MTTPHGFSEEQKECAQTIFDHFTTKEDGKEDVKFREVLLLAEVQSGKTNSFLLTACKLIHHGVIENAVIMSAVADLQLKAQLKKNLAEAAEAYRDLLTSECSTPEGFREINAIIRKIQCNTMICWGNELPKFNIQCENTCFFLDESHFAQDKKMKTDIFFKEQNIQLGENSKELKARNLFVVTISATPFSEISDMVNGKQSKCVVRLRSGKTYRGIGAYMRDALIYGFDTEHYCEQLSALAAKMKQDKYAIIRVQTVKKTMTNNIHNIACKNGIQIMEINGDDSVKTRKTVKKIKFDDMANKPTQATWVLVKSMGRLGQVVPKQHIQFVMETSEKPDADTVIQGLMGRMFGYSDRTGIQIYLSNFVVEKGDLERMVEFYENQVMTSIPKKARNICAGRDKKGECFMPKTNGHEIFHA